MLGAIHPARVHALGRRSIAPAQGRVGPRRLVARAPVSAVERSRVPRLPWALVRELRRGATGADVDPSVERDDRRRLRRRQARDHHEPRVRPRARATRPARSSATRALPTPHGAPSAPTRQASVARLPSRQRLAAKTSKHLQRQRRDDARKWANHVVHAHGVIATENFRPAFLAKSRMARKAADGAIATLKTVLVEPPTERDATSCSSTRSTRPWTAPTATREPSSG